MAAQTVVHLVRHGQTPLNESDVLRGLADPPLDETGRRQARCLGAVLVARRLSAVIASPLLRARQTAQPVAECAGLAVSADECLLDRDYGPWTGVSRDSVTSRWGSVDRAPGVEPQSAVRARAVQGLTDIARRCLGTVVVYVWMHGPDHHHLYAGSYPDADLAWWANRIREWSQAGQDVFVYFNNDGHANAVRNARTLQVLVSAGSR